MHVAVITRHAVTNYGSFLQRRGRPVFIDHCRSSWTWPGWVRERMADTSRPLPQRALRTAATLPMKAVRA